VSLLQLINETQIRSVGLVFHLALPGLYDEGRIPGAPEYPNSFIPPSILFFPPHLFSPPAGNSEEEGLQAVKKIHEEGSEGKGNFLIIISLTASLSRSVSIVSTQPLQNK
jgi:hypothetical protein